MAPNRMAVACAAACAIAFSAAPAHGDPGTNWSLQVPAEPLVAFRGVATLDGAGTGAGGMLYPAPSAAGFLAAVITHGILSESIKQDQKNKLQSTADQVLSPYRSVIDGFTHRDLMRQGLEKMATPGPKRLHDAAETPAGEWVMECAPEFFMTQDQKALVLDNAITLYRPGARASPAYRNTVRVVSQPVEGSDPVGYWTGGKGPRLKEATATLLAESFDLALIDMGAGAKSGDAPFRTMRYFEGGNEKIERAQLIGESCDRLVMKTLRGGILSVPPKASANCTPAATK